MATDAPTWAEYRALSLRVRSVAEGREAAGEQPCAELMRAMQNVQDILCGKGPIRPPSNAKARRVATPRALDGLGDDG